MTRLALRGVVDNDGDLISWPTLLATHEQVFSQLPHLRNYQARWRQWGVGQPVDIDPGGEQFRAQIEDHIARGAA